MSEAAYYADAGRMPKKGEYEDALAALALAHPGGDRLRVEVRHDNSPESPLEHMDCEAVSFSDRHANFKHRDDYFEDGMPIGDLQRQLDTQEAFVLQYYKHGLCEWSLLGEGSPGVEFQWDGVKIAGILFIGTDTPAEHRDVFARTLVKQYTDWCNGHVFGYQIFDGDEELDSCWGFYNAPYFKEEIIAAAGTKDFDITGDAAWVLE